MKIKKNGKIVNLTESDLYRIVKRVLNEDSGQSSIMDVAMSGDFLKGNTNTQELFKKISQIQSKLTYENFLKWEGKKTDSRLWGVCEEDGTGCGACARTLEKGGRTNENGECMEDVINFVRQKGDIKSLYSQMG
tara:strand:+ start:80 stop:481 length:402 start_codon:yes stop_codon:yes gene_type:complete